MLLAFALLAGCEAMRFYLNETAGISPAKLLPLARQERQYVEDRDLEARVKAVVAPSVDVDVYLKEVTLKGASEGDVQAVKNLPGIRSVKLE